MSAPPFHHRTLRRTTWLTLVVWLLALGASVANACLLTPAGPPAALVSYPAAGVHGAGATPAHHRGGDAGPLGCLKFCGDSASLLAKSHPQAPDLDHPIALAPQAWSLPPSTTGQELLRSPHRRDPTGPPIPIRLLRLTL